MIQKEAKYTKLGTISVDYSIYRNNQPKRATYQGILISVDINNLYFENSEGKISIIPIRRIFIAKTLSGQILVLGARIKTFLAIITAFK